MLTTNSRQVDLSIFRQLRRPFLGPRVMSGATTPVMEKCVAM